MTNSIDDSKNRLTQQQELSDKAQERFKKLEKHLKFELQRGERLRAEYDNSLQLTS